MNLKTSTQTRVKRLALNMVAIIFIAPLVVLAADKKQPDIVFGKRLADCGAFFGMISQPNTEFARTFRGLSFIATSYAAEAFLDHSLFEIEFKKSIADITNNLQEFADRHAAQQKIEACMGDILNAQIKFHHGMNEETKKLVPYLF